MDNFNIFSTGHLDLQVQVEICRSGPVYLAMTGSKPADIIYQYSNITYHIPK